MKQFYLDSYYQIYPNFECSSNYITLVVDDFEINLSYQEPYYVSDTPLPLSACAYVVYRGEPYPLTLRKITNTIKFLQAYPFNVDELGSFCSKEMTTFRLYAPLRKKVYLLLNKQKFKMQEAKGTFFISVKGDWHNKPYAYSLVSEVGQETIVDPFAYACDSEKNISYVLDLKRLRKVKVPLKEIALHQRIIYECSAFDFSSSKVYNGRFSKKLLSLIEDNLTYNDKPIGLAYLKFLGITHLQLLPVMDFVSMPCSYSWGYDAFSFNSVEHSYLVNQNKATAYIEELAFVVSYLHKEGIGVNLDIVMSHVYENKRWALEACVPGIWKRFKDKALANGSLCGNEINDQNYIVRKYLIKMLERIVSLFDIDGIRFDLMGLFSISFMQEVEKALRKIKPTIWLYGEGWQMSQVLKVEAATLYNSKKLSGYGFFNDRFRKAIRGDDYNNTLGLALGDLSFKKELKDMYLDANFLQKATQSINYVECHDNKTFYDYCLHFTKEPKRHCLLALAFVILSRGLPFIQAGEEFLRTKKGIANSYQAGAQINMLDWHLMTLNWDCVTYVKDLIALRKKYNLLSEDFIYEDYYEVLIYRNKNLLIFFNPCPFTHIYPCQGTLIFNDQLCDILIEEAIEIPPLTCRVLSLSKN